jgi:hypothetical protein
MTSALEGDEWSAARPGRTLPAGKDPVPILQEAGWAPGQVWTGGKSRPHRDSISGPSSPKSVAIPTETTGSTNDINHYLSGFHLCGLTVYCIFYQYSLRHSADGRDYNRKMLMIVGTKENTFYRNALVGLQYTCIII